MLTLLVRITSKSPTLAIVERGSAGWRGGVEGIEKRASLEVG